ncbi:Uncharacterised protein [Mycobacteroides abscessus subsp. abscessus]|nr:Uncharacterised protein [Mycobacteroides abscessus subsp. abscessus]
MNDEATNTAVTGMARPRFSSVGSGGQLPPDCARAVK